MLAHRHPMHYLDNGAAVLDLVVIASLLLSALVGNLAFLRVLRTVRLLRSYNVLGQLKRWSPAVRRNEEVITAALDLGVFIFMASSLVYVTQRGTNPKIVDFVDALYFSVAALSTTGFGDVTLIGSTGGELLSVAMMIVGISLFFRLAQAAFRSGGGKVRHPCPQCGPAAARRGRGALQGVRAGPQHPRPRPGLRAPRPGHEGARGDAGGCGRVRRLAWAARHGVRPRHPAVHTVPL
jgi:voltage-gated potassium channel